MKKILLFIVVLPIIQLTVLAQKMSQQTEDSAKAAIKQLTLEWNQAIIHRDSASLVRLLAPDYTLNGSVAINNWINNTLHHIVTERLEIIGEQKITIAGDAALSEANFYWLAAFDVTRKINAEYTIHDIWKKNNGHWQVLLRMSSATKTKE